MIRTEEQKNTAKSAIETAIATNQKLIKTIKTRLGLKDEIPPIEAEEKKDQIEPKKEYKSFMKVASLLLVVSFVSVGIACVYVPDIYETVVVFLKDIDPLAVFRGTSDLTFYVN